MNISIWISIIALIVSICAFVYTVLTDQSKIKISLSAKRNSLRVDAHGASIKLLGLIRMILKDPQNEQRINIIKKMVDTAEGLVFIYQELDKDLPIPWLIQTMIATKYEFMSAKLQEFTRVFDKALKSYKMGDINELESATEGMYNRICGKKDSESKKN